MKLATLKKLENFERNGWRPTKAISFIHSLIEQGVPLGCIMTTDVEHSTLKVYVTIPYGHFTKERERCYKRFSSRDCFNALTWYNKQTTTSKGN